jgi:3-dehydroquinate dehydratase-1
MVQVKIGNTVIGGGTVKICIPISARGHAELDYELDHISNVKCDIAEWRFDYWQRGNCGISCEIKKRLIGKPLIFTYRTSREGGFGLDDDDTYCDINTEAIMSGHIDCVDLEFSKGRGLILDIAGQARNKGLKTIISKHIFDRQVLKDEMIEMLCEMQDTGAEIVKLAAHTPDARSAGEVISAAKEMYEKYAKTPFITVGMGEAGKITRAAAPFYGSSMTYARGLRETAPGQIPAWEL